MPLRPARSHATDGRGSNLVVVFEQGVRPEGILGGMEARRTLDLVAGATVATIATVALARLPGVMGITLGDLVPRRSLVSAVVVIGALLPAIVPLCGRAPQRGDKGRRPSRRSIAVTAACGTLVTLAIFGLFDLDVPRRRGVMLTLLAPFVLTSVGFGLRRIGSRTASIGTLVVGIGALAAIHAWDRAPLRKTLPPPSPDLVLGTTPAPADAPSIVLITLDTTRADALGCYGQQRAVTPRIDMLAAQSVVFTAAMSEAPHTHPAMASLLTARFPLEHGSVSGAPHLAAHVTTLAEHLRRRGYATAGFLDNPWLGTEFGLARGYEHLERRVDLERISKWLTSVRDRPFLLHVHLFHPHGPYELRRAELRALGGSEALDETRGRVGMRLGARTIRAGEVPGRHGFAAEEIEWIHDIYLSEVRAMDAVVGELLDLVGDDVIVVLAADHGEEFNERGSLHHSHTLYEELVHVPLMLRAPDLPAPGTRIDASVGLVDVIPTLLDLAHLDALPHAAGRSLAPLMNGATRVDRPVVTQRYRHAGLRDLVAIRSGRWKLHVRITDGEWTPAEHLDSDLALFDLENDPGERDDCVATRPDVVARLLRELAAWRALATARTDASTAEWEARAGEARAQPGPVSPAVRSELKGLGYGR